MKKIFDSKRNYPEYDAYQHDQMDYKKQIKCEIKHCEKCGVEVDAQNIQYRECVLYCVDIARAVMIPTYLCSECGELHEYDGYGDHIYHFGVKDLYQHSLLNQVASSIKYDRVVSIRSWYIRINTIYKENNSIRLLPARSRCAEVWRSFITLQEFLFSNSCPIDDRGLKVNALKGTCTGTPKGTVDRLSMFL